MKKLPVSSRSIGLPHASHSDAYAQAQEAASTWILRIACGTIINTPVGYLAYNDFAQHHVDAFLLSSRAALLSPEQVTIDHAGFVSEVLEAAVDGREVAEDLGAKPFIFPLFLYAQKDVRTRQFIAALCCSSTSGDKGLFVRLPTTVSKGATGAVSCLVQQARYLKESTATCSLDIPRLLGKPLPIDLVVQVKDPSRRALQQILHRSGVLPATGFPVPAALWPHARPRHLTVAPPSRKDVTILFWHALFPTAAGAPGTGFRDRKGLKTSREAVKLVLPPSLPTDHAAIVGEQMHARKAPYDAWLGTTVQRLSIDDMWPVVLPPSAGVGRTHVGGGPAVRAPLTELAAALRRATRLLPGGVLDVFLGDAAPAAGGVTSSFVTQHRAPMRSVRKANEQDLIARSLDLPRRSLDAVPVTPVILPAQVFEDMGLRDAAPHVQHHTAAVPQRMQVQIHPAIVREGCSVDVDGVGVNIRYCPSNVLDKVNSNRLLHATRYETPPAQPAASDRTFAGALRALVSTTVRMVTGTAAGSGDAAADLRAANAPRRPAHLAVASSASLIKANPPLSDARAAVTFVFDFARTKGLDLSHYLVAVPACGSVTVTTITPTVDASFVSRRTNDPYLLPTTGGSATEPLQVVVVGTTHAHLVAATRDVLQAIVEAERSSGGSTGAARAAGLSTRGPHDVVVVGGGGLVTISILVLLMVRHAQRAQSTPFAFIKMYNQKARGVTCPVAGALLLDDTDAGKVSNHLLGALRRGCSLVELIIDMFGEDCRAADRYIGVGAAVDTVRGAFEGAAFAAIALAPATGGKLRVGIIQPPVPEEDAGDGVEESVPPHSSKWVVDHYWPFCTPTRVAPCTAYRSVTLLGAGFDRPVPVRLESYHRLANDTAAPDVISNAGKLIEHVKTNTGTGNPVLRVRTLEGVTHTAAVHASTHVAMLERRGGEMPRLDATFALPEGMTFADALTLAIQDATDLLRRGLVTTPLGPVLCYMASVMTSLFALHYAALRAVQVKGAAQMASLSAYLYLRQTAACMRSLSTGRNPGHGVPGTAFAVATGLPPAGALAPPPALVARALGLPHEAAFAHDPLPGTSRLPAQDPGDTSAAIAARTAAAFDAMHTVEFRCRHVDAAGTPCGLDFHSSDLLHRHLTDKGHHYKPGPGGFAVHSVKGSDLVDSELRGVSDEQKAVILAILATGKHSFVGGAAGTGKSVLGKALVACLRSLHGMDAVLYVTPTTMSAHATGDPEASTIHRALHFGVPENSTTIDTLTNRTAANTSVCKRMEAVKFLVMDEGGRLGHREVSAALNVLRAVNKDKDVAGRAGSVQVICLGDLGQTLDFSGNTLQGAALEERPHDVWPLSPLADELDLLVFDLMHVWRQDDREYVRHLSAVRSGAEAWQPGQPAYDFFKLHCSPDLEHNAGLTTRDTHGTERVTLEAVKRGFVTLVSTKREADTANHALRQEARQQATPGAWKEVTIIARDGTRSLDTGRICAEKDAIDTHDRGAPAKITFYPGQAVAVAKGTWATLPDGNQVLLPSSLLGTVITFNGDSLDNVRVTVHFPKSTYGPEVIYIFKAEQVDESDVIAGFKATRRMVQLRDGRFMTVHRAQSLGFDLLIIDMVNAGSAWARALIYTALSRGRTLRCMIIINQAAGKIHANIRELAWVSQRAELTRNFMQAQDVVAQTPLLVRDVASFLATRLRRTDDAAARALRMSERGTRSSLAVLDPGPPDELPAKRAGAKRRRRSCSSSDSDLSGSSWSSDQSSSSGESQSSDRSSSSGDSSSRGSSGGDSSSRGSSGGDSSSRGSSGGA